MDETITQNKSYIRWFDLIIYAIYCGLIYYHATTQSGNVLLVLTTMVAGVAVLEMFKLFRIWRLVNGLAIGTLMGIHECIHIVRAMYPFSVTQLGHSVIYVGIAVYMVGADVYFMVPVAIMSCVANFFLYNVIVQAVKDPDHQTIAANELELSSIESRMNAIFNEELEKVMADVTEKARIRWEAAGLILTETTNNECDERGESDSTGIATPDENDRS